MNNTPNNELDLLVDEMDKIVGENNQELTDEQVEDIVAVLKENREKYAKEPIQEDNVTEFPFNTITKDEVVSGYANVTVDPITGEHKITPLEQNNTPSLSELSQDEKSMESYNETLNDYGLNEEEAGIIFNLIMRGKRGEKFSAYNEMPDKVKLMVRNLAGTSNMSEVQQCAKLLLDQFAMNMEVDKEFVNLQESVAKELNSIDVMAMYDSDLKESMEVKLVEKAKEIEASNPEGAKKLLAVSEAYTMSYTFKPLIEAIENNEKCCRRLDKEIKRYKRHCDEFNYKYIQSKYTINNIQLVAHTLKRVLTNVEEECIMRFVILFCRYTMNMSSEVPEEHAYMYYTVKNILSLDFLKPEDDMYIEIVSNINKVIDLIIEKDRKEFELIKLN